MGGDRSKLILITEKQTQTKVNHHDHHLEKVTPRAQRPTNTITLFAAPYRVSKLYTAPKMKKKDEPRLRVCGQTVDKKQTRKQKPSGWLRRVEEISVDTSHVSVGKLVSQNAGGTMRGRARNPTRRGARFK